MMPGTQGKQKTPPQESFVGQTLCHGEYAVHKILGHGGMGRVYLASHTVLTVPLALKQARADMPLPESVVSELDYILHGGDVTRHASLSKGPETDFPDSGGQHTDRFLREALLLARLQHPSIPSLYDYLYEDGNWYLVMDYIPGPTLGAYLRQHAPLPPLEALNYAMQLCDVLDYLHKQAPPIVFRDLKPSNVILTPDGALMLVDFGIARYFKDGQISDTTDFGSPGYASPEQYQGEGQTDGRSDLYSLGILLQEMVSRRSTATGAHHPSQQGHAMSTVLSSLITLATRSEPSHRFQTAHTFYLALERAYNVEERRAYRRHTLKVKELEKVYADESSKLPAISAMQAVAEKPSNAHTFQKTPSTPGMVTDDIAIFPILSFNLEQRRQTREAVQQVRSERLEQERMEIQLASVDESLKLRSSIPLSLSSPFAVTEKFGGTPTPMRPSRRARFIIQTGFILATLLFLIMASLLVYVHYKQRQSVLTHTYGTAVTSTAASVVTTTGGFSSAWQVLPSLPSAEADNTAIYVQVQGRNYIYMSGGYRGPTQSPYYDRNLYRYDIAAAHWEVVANSQLPGMLNNAVASDGQGNLFFTAGYSTDSYAVSSLLYMYQPGNDMLQKIVPPPQVHLGFGGSILADQHGHLYLSQGFLQSGNAQASAGTGWYRYDISTGAWHLMAPLPSALGYVMLGMDGNTSILLLGGAADAGQLMQTNSVYRYDIAGDRWQQEHTTTPRTFSGSASCVTGQGQLIILGGYDASVGAGLNQAWLVDLHTLSWTALAAFPPGGSVLGTAACDTAGHIFLVRGASNPNHPFADFWELTINKG